MRFGKCVRLLTILFTATMSIHAAVLSGIGIISFPPPSPDTTVGLDFSAPTISLSFVYLTIIFCPYYFLLDLSSKKRKLWIYPRLAGILQSKLPKGAFA